MKYACSFSLCLLALACGCGVPSASRTHAEHALSAGEKTLPAGFPAAIRLACDFELERRDIVWSGNLEREDMPAYPGNTASLAARPLMGADLLLLSVRPVIPPLVEPNCRIGFRYCLDGADCLTIEIHYLDGGSRNAALKGLETGAWSVANVPLSIFGTEDNPDQLPRRVQEVAFIVSPESKSGNCRLLVDDVICFAESDSGGEPSGVFPNRVILLEQFDIVELHSHWQDAYNLERNVPGDTLRGAARGTTTSGAPGARVQVSVDPIQAVGVSTRIHFRYLVRGISRLQVMLFDLTAMDNRHIVMETPVRGRWLEADLDFSRDSRRNDGTGDSFAPGHRVDDIFFFSLEAEPGCELLIDDVVLYDAGPGGR